VRTDPRTRILIVEDHQVVADGLAALINDQTDMTVIGHAGSVNEAIARATASIPPDASSASSPSSASMSRTTRRFAYWRRACLT